MALPPLFASQWATPGQCRGLLRNQGVGWGERCSLADVLIDGAISDTRWSTGRLVERVRSGPVTFPQFFRLPVPIPRFTGNNEVQSADGDGDVAP